MARRNRATGRRAPGLDNATLGLDSRVGEDGPLTPFGDAEPRVYIFRLSILKRV